MKYISTLLSLALLVNIIGAQISFFDQRFPPAPATRRTIVIRNGQLTGRRSAALQQAPDPQISEPLSQQYEDSAQEQDQDLQEPIVQQTVPTQRPQRNGNGVTQQPVTSRAVNGFPRIPQQQQQFGQTVGSEEETDEVVSQRQDSGLTDISMEDVSTERITPSVTFTSSEEESTDDGFTPTEPEQRPVVTTTGTISTQRKSNGNGKQRQSNGSGRKTLLSSGQKPVGNENKPSIGRNGRNRQPVTQLTDGDAQVIDGQLTDGQIGGDRDQTQAVGGDQHSGGDEHSDHHSGDPIQWLRDAIRGEPGVDYPIFYTPPETSFKCSDQQYPGYYADVDARCQVFHICQEKDRSDAFLCPNGTVFSQQNFVCVWWHDFDCSSATQLYSLNAQLFSSPETPPEGSGEPLDKPAAQPAGATRGRPSTRPTGLAPDQAIGTGLEGPADERIQTVEGQEPIEGQGPGLPQVFESDDSSQQTPVDDSQVVVSDEAAAQESLTTSAPINGLRAPNGRPSGGVKGGRRNGIRSRVNGNGAKRDGDQQRVSVTTTRPLTGFKRNGAPKRNGSGSQSVPSSPADTARNGLQKTNGVNGSQQPKRQNAGTKSVFRDRTTQSKELDSQSSNWYYYLTGK